MFDDEEDRELSRRIEFGACGVVGIQSRGSLHVFSTIITPYARIKNLDALD